jgi:hypothetical protein
LKGGEGTQDKTAVYDFYNAGAGEVKPDFYVTPEGTAIPSADSFKSFPELKQNLGNAQSGNALHHIVEQNPTNKAQFMPEMLQNKQNIIELPNNAGDVHRIITGFSNSKPRYLGGQKVRDWVSQKSFGEQFDFGMDMVKKYGDVEWNPNKGWIFKPNK